jgi:hypothetical protein
MTNTLETLQTAGVVEAKLTARWELASAAITNGAPPKIWSGMRSKVIVWVPNVTTVMLRITFEAAAYRELPAWLAVIEHVPAASRVSAEPLTVQMAAVVDEKLTARPELAVAVSARGAEGSVTRAGAENVIVCGSSMTLKLWTTGVAAAKVAFPAWLAVMEHVPSDTSVRYPDDPLPRVQTAGVVDANATTSPDDAVAFSTTSPSISGTLFSGPNVIVWGVRVNGLTCIEILFVLDESILRVSPE